MEGTVAKIAILALLLFAGSGAVPLEAYVIASKSNVDFSTAKVDEKIGTFLVLNPGLTNLATYLKFNNDCNVEHFRREILTIPLQSVRLRINGVLEAAPIWTRGTDCTAVLSWSPPGPGPYASSYQIDVLASWDPANMSIAGAYSESVNITAITIP